MNTFFIARPIEKAVQSVDYFKEHGLDAVSWPVIDIQLLELYSVVLANQNKFEFDIIIVTSTYAVDWLNEKNGISVFDLTKTKNIICVGSSTAKTLTGMLTSINSGFDLAKISVAEPPNSEGILACRCLQRIQNTQIAIIKGRGGRNLLEHKLSEKHAQLTVLDVYQRIVNTRNLDNNRISIKCNDCIIATSVEIAEAIFNNYDSVKLKSVTWIVPSARIKQHIKRLGVANVILSENASAHSLAQTALQLVKEGVLDG